MSSSLRASLHVPRPTTVRGGKVVHGAARARRGRPPSRAVRAVRGQSSLHDRERREIYPHRHHCRERRDLKYYRTLGTNLGSIVRACYMAAPSSSVASLASPFWSTPALALARSRTLLAHDAASISTTPRAGASLLAAAGVVGSLAATEAACPPVCCSTLAAARA